MLVTSPIIKQQKSTWTWQVRSLNALVEYDMFVTFFQAYKRNGYLNGKVIYTSALFTYNEAIRFSELLLHVQINFRSNNFDCLLLMR